MLTEKQEKFLRNILNGMTQREAYKNSYNAENMLDKTIDEEACKLFNDPKLATRYREMQDELTSEAIMTARERLEYLSGIVQDVNKEKGISISKDGISIAYESCADLNTKIKAIDIMNKMQGEYTTKIEGNMTVRKLEDLI